MDQGQILLVLATIASTVATVAFALGLGVPKSRPPGLRGAISRWGHAAVWLLLTATFVALVVGYSSLASVTGIAALVTYVVFLGVLIGSRRNPEIR